MFCPPKWLNQSQRGMTSRSRGVLQAYCQFSINQLVRENIILKEQKQSEVKCEFSTIVSNLRIDSFRH